jgi:hypothetical protein
MPSFKFLKVRIGSITSIQKVNKALKTVAIALAVGLSARAAYAAPPSLEAAQSTIKTFCAHAYATGSQDWTLCVSQGTQGYVEFADAYPQADPPLKEAFEQCQARYGRPGNWSLAGWCARERARYFEELR